MKIHLDYRNPTPSHCDVAVFVNGALAGVLTLRQEELDVFQHIILHGIDPRRDEFLGTGDPGPRPVDGANQQMRSPLPPYYIGGPYLDGRVSICETATGLIRRLLSQEELDALAVAPTPPADAVPWPPSAANESRRHAELDQQLVEAARGAARYEIVRRLSPREFKDLWTRNLDGHQPFDSLVDELGTTLKGARG